MTCDVFQENTFAGKVSSFHVGGAQKQPHHICVSRHAQKGESPELDGPRTAWLETLPTRLGQQIKHV